MDKILINVKKDNKKSQLNFSEKSGWDVDKVKAWATEKGYEIESTEIIKGEVEKTVDDTEKSNDQKQITKKKGDEADISNTVDLIKSSTNKRIVYGVVYQPDTPDSDNEFMKADQIESMAHRFMMFSQNMDKDHRFIKGSGLIVESFIVRDGDKDFVDENKKSLVGAWVLGVKVTDDDLWKKIKKGEVKAFSFAGRGEYGKTQEMDSDWYDEDGNFHNIYEDE